MKKLDIQSPVPLYHQLKETLRGLVESGQLKPEEKIPAEMDIAEEYQISRSTVRSAILDLVREGVFTRQRGRGTFVAPPKEEISYIVDFFPSRMCGRHENISFQHITAPVSLSGVLHISENDYIYSLIRLRYIKEIPSVLEKSYIAEQLCPEFHSLPSNYEGKIYEWINCNCKRQIHRAITNIEPVILDKYECDLFHLSGTVPAFLISRLNLDEKGNPVVFSKSIVRGDKFRIEVKTSEQGIITVENR